jgi:hypothetical protein
MEPNWENTAYSDFFNAAFFTFSLRLLMYSVSDVEKSLAT